MSEIPPSLDLLPPPPTRGMARAAFVAAAKAFLAALVVLVVQINALVAWLVDIGSRITLPRNGTSTTNLTIGAGDKAFTTQPGLGILKGYKAGLFSSASPENQMRGVVKSYDPVTGDGVLTVTDIDGAGTFASWIFGQIPYTKKASAAQIAAGVSDDTYVSPKGLVDSANYQALTDASTIAWDLAAGYNAKVTLGGNRTFGAPTNIKPGMAYTLAPKQDATGSRVPAYASAFDFGNQAPPILSTGANKQDYLYFQGNPAGDKLVYLGFSKSA